VPAATSSRGGTASLLSPELLASFGEYGAPQDLVMLPTNKAAKAAAKAAARAVARAAAAAEPATRQERRAAKSKQRKMDKLEVCAAAC